jgi:hypothetical protein
MRNDDFFQRHLWGYLTETARNIFVGQAVKSVTPHPFVVKPLRKRIVISQRTVATVKCGVETGDLRKIWKSVEKHADWCQIVRLMQRRKRDILLQPRENVCVDDHGLAVFRSAMHDAVSDRDRV